MAVQIQIRNGTASAWTSANPTLAVGEMGAETDTGRFKIGTGSTAWNSLGYSLGVASKGTYSGATQYYVNDIVLYNGSSYICILASLGNLPTNGTYWNLLVQAGAVSSVAQTFTGGIVSVAGSPITGSGTLALTVAGTSGGVPYFSSGSAWASSAALAANALVIGGGAGAAPATTTTGTGVLTFLGTPSSANLFSALTDDTGTGLVVFNNAPALTNPTVTNYVETLYSANTGTAITVDLTNGTVQNLTLTGNATITMPTAVAGKSFIIILSQDGTGGRTVTWSTVSWPSATAPTVTSTASKRDIFSFFSNGTSWFGTTIGQNYT
jgi:hypothetical protein